MQQMTVDDSVRESPIKCIFFCEFDPEAGPKITYQVPRDYINKGTFESLREYLIPKIQLQHKLVTVNMCGMKVLGFPDYIESSEYERNQLMFNMCFVCDSNMRTLQYEPIVKKLAHYLVTLEKECKFLSAKEAVDDRNGKTLTKADLPSIMSQMMHDLNIKRSSSIPINESITIYLKVNKVEREPTSVLDHHVPTFTENLPKCIPTTWDLTTQQILPLIDGYRHVAKIAQEADVNVNLVKACIRNMIYYGVITVLPIFLYNASYAVTPKINQLFNDSHLRDDCYRACATDPRAQFRNIFQMYCTFTPTNTVRDICIRFKPRSLYIDEKQLVQFGVRHGILRRLYKYPINETFVATRGPSSNSKVPDKFFTGAHHYDAICCTTGLSYRELERIAEEDCNVVVCSKSGEELSASS